MSNRGGPDRPGSSRRVRFPGYELPAEIAVRDEEGDYAYVPSHLACWDDIEAGHRVRVRALRRAEERLLAYEVTMDRLRPLMEPNPERTVEEAVEIASARDPATLRGSRSDLVRGVH
ncbi:MAG: hypothetical protein LBV60_04705 [Streptomyces sp.]|jgi:hypothetical protein|nr:hypothetical protein [Streptomyces sp.]